MHSSGTLGPGWSAPSPQTGRAAPPPHVRLPLHHPASAPQPAQTGSILPLLAADLPDPRTVAVLFLAKADTRFRRLGLWGLRPWLLTALPPALAFPFTRGRSGRLPAGDW